MSYKRHVNGGFSLLEMTVVIIVATILATAIIPQLIKGYLINAANKTALDMSAIEEAARAYYIANNNWPSSIAVLQTGNYLPSSWNAINPFGYSSATPLNYSYNILSNPSLLTVSTFIPISAQVIIQNLLPATSVSGGNIYTSVPVPGSSSVLPPGLIMSWASSNLPTGFLWCNGQAVSRTVYSGLFAVIGTLYGAGDDSTTFNLPNTMGRTIVGVDGMGGVSPTNLITQWSTTPSTMGGTFGEDAHRQSVTEMAPHDHAENPWVAIDLSNSKGLYGSSPGGHASMFSPVPRTGISGGNGDATGLGAPSNVVPPSISMGYIIKY
jgi:prepilin-type N-terminal cleavage/methylation domain-containing protein